MSRSKPSLGSSKARVSDQDELAFTLWGYARIVSDSNPVSAGQPRLSGTRARQSLAMTQLPPHPRASIGTGIIQLADLGQKWPMIADFRSNA